MLIEHTFAMSCPSTFLSTPNGLITICHVITIVEVPFHIVGAYCILAKTPEKMKNVKMSLLNLHFLTVFLDLSAGFLLIPFVLLPTFSGAPLGLLTTLRVPVVVQIYIGVTSIAVTGVAILAVFENRYYRLFHDQNWKKYRAYYLLFNYFLAFTFLSYPFSQIPDQDYGRKIVLENLPCTPDLSPDQIYVFSLDTNIPIFLITFMLITVVSQIVILFAITIRRLMIQYQHLSVNTYQIQQKFMKAIFVQFLITLGLFAAPIGFLCYSLITKVFEQAINNLCFITLTLYGLISTIIMITIHQPYREWIFKKRRSSKKIDNRNSIISIL